MKFKIEVNQENCVEGLGVLVHSLKTGDIKHFVAIEELNPYIRRFKDARFAELKLKRAVEFIEAIENLKTA